MPDNLEILEQIAAAQSRAIQDFMVRMAGEPLPPLYAPSYAVHTCTLCGNTERLEDAPCPRCQP